MIKKLETQTDGN